MDPLKEEKDRYKTRSEAARFVLGYLGEGIAISVKYLKQGRIREAKRNLSDCLDLYQWFKSLPVFIPSTPTPTAGLPAGDKD